MGNPYYARSRGNLDTDWMIKGACAEAPASEHWRTDIKCSIFFADNLMSRSRAHLAAVVDAKELCGRCEVQTECLQYAFDADCQGIWGGFTEEERKRLPRSLRVGSAQPEPPRSVMP